MRTVRHNLTVCVRVHASAGPNIDVPNRALAASGKPGRTADRLLYAADITASVARYRIRRHPMNRSIARGLTAAAGIALPTAGGALPAAAQPAGSHSASASHTWLNAVAASSSRSAFAVGYGGAGTFSGAVAREVLGTGARREPKLERHLLRRGRYVGAAGLGRRHLRARRAAPRLSSSTGTELAGSGPRCPVVGPRNPLRRGGDAWTVAQVPWLTAALSSTRLRPRARPPGRPDPDPALERQHLAEASWSSGGDIPKE
jgi:hypothetical protein